ncbi:MAG: glycosyltransferase family 9 protein [Thermodesulfobacteriota bacterium]|nr:glycosyltransferase family 9 protein [Thermodesulfobacteriota bacterium]
MTQPAWSHLSAALPAASIDLLCRPHIAPLFRDDPAISSVVPCESQRFRSWLFKNRSEVQSLLIHGNYDAVIDFTALPLTAAVCAAKKAPPSVGFHRIVDTVRGAIDLGLAYDRTFPYSEKAPIRHLMLQLVSPWAGLYEKERPPLLHFRDKAIRKTASTMRKKGLKEGDFVILHPGGKWSPKRWPICHWRDLLSILNRQLDMKAVVMGSTGDREQVRAILDGHDHGNCDSFISNDIEVSSAMMKAASLCVCNDSAPMHMAAAVGTPSVSLFGPVQPRRSAPPNREGCTVLYDAMFCSPCTLYYSRDRCRRGINFCMHAIRPEMVCEAVEHSLRKRLGEKR